MPIAGGAHSPWQFWDGRADSQWAQALGPLESGVEHGGDRTLYAHVIAANYRERTVQLSPTRFDRYVAVEVTGAEHSRESVLGSNEVAGLRLFIGKANCINCHNGARFTDDHFHNTGIPSASGLPPDSGRAVGMRQVMSREFNCLSRHSDTKVGGCAELQYAFTDGNGARPTSQPGPRPPDMPATRHAGRPDDGHSNRSGSMNATHPSVHRPIAP